MFEHAQIFSWLTTHGLNLLVTFVVLLVAYNVLVALSHPLSRFMPQASKLLFEHIVEGFLKLFIVMVGIVYALPQFGIDQVPLLAGFGLVIFAFTNAAQKNINDIISGFILVAENKLVLGNEYEFAAKNGILTRLGIRGCTLFEACAAREHFVPYGDIRVISRRIGDSVNAAEQENTTQQREGDGVRQHL